jgi:hypothetical protein
MRGDGRLMPVGSYSDSWRAYRDAGARCVRGARYPARLVETFSTGWRSPKRSASVQNYLRGFCGQCELSLSRHGHSVTWRGQYYQVFMLAEEAELFSKEFGGGGCIRQNGARASVGHNGREVYVQAQAPKRFRSPPNQEQFVALAIRLPGHVFTPKARPAQPRRPLLVNPGGVVAQDLKERENGKADRRTDTTTRA